QVKIRGFRIELGDIESQLLKLPEYEEVAVIDRMDQSGDKYLCAYLVSGTEPNVDYIREELSKNLPDYMIPAFYVRLDAMPLNNSGKLNRKALPEPDLRSSKEFVPASTATEKILTEIWQEILGLEQISILDNFFELGGHSLKAMNLSSMIQKQMKRKISLQDIFAHGTVQQLARLIDAQQEVEYTSILIQSKHSHYPLSPSQKRMYLLNSLESDSSVYNIPFAMNIRGKIDVQRLETIFQDLIQRHESLRTSFGIVHGEPVQYIHDQLPFHITQRKANQKDWKKETDHFVQSFDLQNAPLIRVCLVSEDEEQHLLLCDMHHIISDGSSLEILSKEFISLYRGQSLEATKIQYRDYAMWQTEQIGSQAYLENESYWVDRFQGELPVLSIPTDYQRPAVQQFDGKAVYHELSTEESRSIKQFLHEEGITEFMFFLAVYQLLLSKYSGQNDLVIGTPIAGREHPDVKDLVGLFVNTLALRSQLDRQMSFRDFLQQIKRESLEAFEYQDYPFEALLEKLDIQRDISRNPLFDTMFSYEKRDDKLSYSEEEQFSFVEMEIESSKFDLDLVVIELQNKITLQLSYCTALFREERMENMMGHFQALLSNVLLNPDAPLSSYLILSSEEISKQQERANKVRFATAEKTIAGHFIENLSKNKDKTALLDFDRTLSHQEFAFYMSEVQQILREAGVQKGDVVGVHMNPCIELPPIVFGIWAYGAIYLPIDLQYPEQRVDHMIEDSRCRFLFLDQNALLKTEIPHTFKENLSGKNQELPIHRASAMDDAYIIYTSGTTGMPKGVVIRHHSIYDYIEGLVELIGIHDQDCTLQHASISFDTSMEELLSTLFVGGKVFVLDHQKDLTLISKAIETGHPTLLATSPQVVNFLNQPGSDLKNIRVILSGGEELKADYFTHLDHKIEVWNGYGPTESTVCITFKKIDRAHPVISLGHPIRNREVYILDQDLNPLPDGFPGELCVAGLGLAKEYLNAPGITADKFVPHPFKKGEKIYRTGDLSLWNRQGELDFLGRIDKQVKIRGYRVEIGEIEDHLLSIPEIKNAVVLDKKQGHTTYLCAYIETLTEIENTFIKERLAEHLPAYMIPTVFIHLESFPLTSNGKIDRKALPEPEEALIQRDYTPPRNEREQLLADIWGNVLNKEQVGIDDDYFELGGDSIKSIQVLSRLRDQGLNFEMRQLFEHPNIRKLAPLLTETAILVDQSAFEGSYTPSPIQVDFLENYPKPDHYNQSVLLESTEAISMEYLEQCISELSNHHDLFRTRYENQSLTVLPEGTRNFALNKFKCEDRKLDTFLAKQAQLEQESLDISNGPLMRIAIFETDRRTFLLLIVHHLIIDGISWRILLEDFQNLYEANVNGQSFKLPNRTHSFAEWTKQLKEYSSGKSIQTEIPYWKALEGNFADDQQESKAKTYEVGIQELSLSRTLSISLLSDAHRAYQTEVNDLLLAALSRAYANWSQKDQVLIDLEGHGREDLIPGMDISRTLGWFTSLYPVGLHVDSNNSLSRHIQETKESLRKVPSKGVNYQILKYYSPKEIISELQFKLKSPILFNYLGDFGNLQSGNESIFKPSSLDHGQNSAPENLGTHSLEINAINTEAGLRFNISYNSLEYTPEEINRFSESLLLQLEEVIVHCQSQKGRISTPSDYALAHIDFEELEQIQTQFSDSEIADIYPLSPMQEGMLFHALIEPDSLAYREQTILHLKGVIDVACFERSLQQLFDRHEILRTRFVYEQSQTPLQVVLEQVKVTLNYQDWSQESSEVQEGKITDLSARLHQEKVDFSANLLQAVLICKSPEDHVLIWNHHHILMDGWCNSLLIKEFLGIYEAEVDQSEFKLPRPKKYADYIKWLAKQDDRRSEEFWSEFLRSYDQHVKLPVKEESDRNDLIERHTLTINEDYFGKVQELAQGLKATPYNVLQAIWGILLQRYNNSDDIIFGSVVSGRPSELEGVEDMIGLFINTVPVRIQNQQQSFEQLVSELQKQALEKLNFEHYPLAKIQNLSELKQDLITNLMIYENFPMSEVGSVSGNKKQVFEIVGTETLEQTNYDLSLVLVPGKDLKINFDYRSSIYDSRLIERISGQFLHLLEQVIENPSVTLPELKILNAQEEYELLKSSLNLPEYQNPDFIESFMSWAKEHPEDLALSFEDRDWTYHELDQLSGRIAQALVQRGIDQDAIVAMLFERSESMLITILGILKAGGAYLPLDPNYPKDRINYVLEDSKTSLLIGNMELEGIQYSGEQLNYEELLEATQEAGSIQRKYDKSQLAYVMYTSGSTGLPKGVAVTRGNVSSFVSWSNNEFQKTPFDVVFAGTSYSFDLSVYEFFYSLQAGKRIRLLQSGLEIPKYLKQEKNILLNSVPSVIHELVVAEEDFSHVNAVNMCGEPVSFTIKEKLEFDRIEVRNLYGPSEDTTYSTCFIIDELDERQLIGVPIEQTQVFVVDQQLRLVPKGVPGELCLAGEQLARGYLHKAKLTEERFVREPFPGVKRMYRTGDLVRMREQGDLEFLGRLDHQVKIRGFRIELGEIETRLLQLDKLKEAVVVDRELSGVKVLCAYYASSSPVTVDEIEAHLQEKLPEYMVPQYFMELSELPQTPNGKVDRKALPDPDFSDTRKYVAPETNTEQQLAQIWQQLLELEEVSVLDNFFDLGGHSLKAMGLGTQIHKVFGVKIPLNLVFEAPTIRELSREIDAQGSDSSFEQIPKAAIAAYYRMSSAQKRMFLLQQFEVDSTAYNMPGMVRVTGDLQVDRLNKAFNSVVARHASLRTNFKLIDQEPVQFVNGPVEVTIERIHAKNQKPEEILENFIRPFDLEKDSLIRLGLVETDNGERYLIMDTHHIISDGASGAILLADLLSAYGNHELAPLHLQYVDYSEWQNQRFEAGTLSKSKEFWFKHLDGEIPVLNLPYDYPRPLNQVFEGDVVRFELDEELTNSLKQFAQYSNSTLFMVLMAAYQVLLSRYSGQDDIIVGTPVAGRSHHDLNELIGLFVNTLAIRAYPEGEKSFAQFLNEMKERSLETFEHQDYPFDQLVEELDLRRDLSRNPLFDAFLVLQNTDRTKLESKDLSFETIIPDRRIAKFDLNMEVTEEERLIAISLEYATSLFKRESAEKISRHFVQLLREVIQSPQTKIGALKILDQQENLQILKLSSGIRKQIEQESILKKIADQVTVQGASSALIFGEQRMSYQELDQRSDRLAKVLNQCYGVTAGQRVAILMDRSFNPIISMLGILKAGAAYVPIDTAYPEERISYIRDDANVRMVLCDTRYTDEKNYFTLDELLKKEIDETVALSKPGTSDLAYLIYTSGSTGRPKGCELTHANLNHYISWANDYYFEGIQPQFALFTSLSFDLTITSIFTTLSLGGGIHIYEKEMDMSEILGNLFQADSSVNAIKLTPSHLALLSHLDVEKAPLKVAILGGEQLSVDQVSLLRQHVTSCRIYNEYGPTETTVGCIVKEVLPEDHQITIGRPIANTNAYVLSSGLQLLPTGAVGELFISGAGVGKGYYERPELNEERFLDDPFIGEGKMYRTGDLVKWLPDGEMQYLGRVDQQIKIRGYRVELGEIESVLKSASSINQLVVIDRESADKSKYLCAYYISDKELDTESVRKEVAGSLPDYMIPSYFIRVDEIPLTSNGKLNRQLLPEPNDHELREVYLPAENETQEQLITIWEELLQKEQVGITDHFFHLGGHSLRAMILSARIQKEFEVKLSLQDIFSHPTVQSLSQVIESTETQQFQGISKAVEKDFYPASAAQKRMFLLQQFNPEGTAYNMPGIIRVKGSIEKEKLTKAFKELVKKHDSLRTNFKLIDQEAVQIVKGQATTSLEVIDAQNKSPEEILAAFIRAFDLENEVLIRLGLASVTDKEHYLLLDSHHIISDGVSSSLILRDLIQAYSGQELIPSNLQYVDFSEWQNKRFNSGVFENMSKFWTTQFQDEIPILNLPYDFARPGNQKFEGSAVRLDLDSALSKQLNQLAQKQGVTLFMLLLSAYKILLAKYSGQNDLIVGTPVAGRSHHDLEDMVGLFVNTLALRSTPEQEKSFSQYLSEIKTLSLNAFEHQEYPFDQLVEELNLRRDLSRSPLFDAFFVLQNVQETKLNAGGLEFETVESSGRVAKFDLSLQAFEDGDSIHLDFEYANSLFKQETIERLSRHFVHLLQELIEAPDKKIGLLNILNQDERKQILLEFNETKHEFEDQVTLKDLFDRQVARNPEAIALVFESEEMTYRELDRRSNQLAHHLISHGVESDQLVPLVLERSFEMVIAMLAIHKAGGAYMPIDPQVPSERLQYLLQDSQAKVVLCDRDLTLENQGIRQLNLSEKSWFEGTKSSPATRMTPDNLAYVIYTSGSTGNPKGVMLEHRGVINRIQWMKEHYGFSEQETVLQKTTYTFDVSVWEFFMTLSYGAKLVQCRKEVIADVPLLIDHIERHQVSVLHFVPSMFKLFLGGINEANQSRLKSIRQIFASGEALSPEYVQKHHQLLNAELHNLYGPTEASVDVSYYETQAHDQLVPIGKPVWNTQLLVLNEQLQLQAVGVPGELHIGGTQVARGYLNQPELTAEKFIENPYQ
ncbi:MAG: amino acid adenylation domain-containing protein, partial [Bacteroidetes bacterium]